MSKSNRSYTRYGSSFRRSRGTPAARRHGPVKPRAIASFAVIGPTPIVRSMKIRFFVRSAFTSAMHSGITPRQTARSRSVHPSGRSAIAPPIRVYDVVSRWPHSSSIRK